MYYNYGQSFTLKLVKLLHVISIYLRLAILSAISVLRQVNDNLL